MQLSDFDFNLPPELIAQYPLTERRDSRLLTLSKSGAINHQRFVDLKGFLKPGDLLVVNDTQVIPARLLGHKSTGGQVEVLVERIVDEHQALAHVRASKAPKPGALLIFAEGIQVEVRGRQGDLFHLHFLNETPVLEVLNRIGHIPLPPYIERQDENLDLTRYQTVFAQQAGAVAAPTAGLHFDEDFLVELEQMGVELAYVTLHVGAGTFQPVRVTDISQHVMHSEWMQLSAAVCEKITQVKAAGKRVIAIGTTVVRCLESAAQQSLPLKPYSGETAIFIYPGFEFKVVDALVTNFHLPGSTLLMLVSALVGKEHILRAYQAAIAEKYRFFSYGDAMLIY